MWAGSHRWGPPLRVLWCAGVVFSWLAMICQLWLPRAFPYIVQTFSQKYTGFVSPWAPIVARKPLISDLKAGLLHFSECIGHETMRAHTHTCALAHARAHACMQKHLHPCARSLMGARMHTGLRTHTVLYVHICVYMHAHIHYIVCSAVGFETLT